MCGPRPALSASLSSDATAAAGPSASEVVVAEAAGVLREGEDEAAAVLAQEVFASAAAGAAPIVAEAGDVAAPALAGGDRVEVAEGVADLAVAAISLVQRRFHPRGRRRRGRVARRKGRMLPPPPPLPPPAVASLDRRTAIAVALRIRRPSPRKRKP